MNMRLRRPGLTPAEVQRIERFAEWLRNVGTGRENDAQNYVKLPDYLNVLATPPAAEVPQQNAPNLDLQISEPYLPLTGHCYSVIDDGPVNPTNPDWMHFFSRRAILSAKDLDVDAINSNVLAKLLRNSMTFRSADFVPSQHEERDRSGDIPVEILKTMRFPGLPAHLLKLKIGAPSILLRNMDPSHGLYNGSRLLLTNMDHTVLEAVIISGDHGGEKVFIPRLALDHEDVVMSVKIRRLQFPVKLAFAFTINKSQGQCLDIVGLDLTNEVFGHGQLYVALARDTNAENFKILPPNNVNSQARICNLPPDCPPVK